jgi:hypothetical protein
LKIGQPLRVIAAALVLSTLSFAAGIAGDLSIAEPPNYGERVVLRIPPAIPDDAPRAGPLLSTASAEARPLAPAHRARPIEANFASLDLLQAPETELELLTPAKFSTVLAAKPDERRKVV